MVSNSLLGESGRISADAMKNHSVVWSKLDEKDKWGSTEPRPLKTPPRKSCLFGLFPQCWMCSHSTEIYWTHVKVKLSCQRFASLNISLQINLAPGFFPSSAFCTLGCVKGVWVSGLSRETGDCGRYISVSTVTGLTEREKEQGLVTLTFTLRWMKLLLALLLRKHNAKVPIALRHSLRGEC